VCVKSFQLPLKFPQFSVPDSLMRSTGEHTLSCRNHIQASQWSHTKAQPRCNRSVQTPPKATLTPFSKSASRTTLRSYTILTIMNWARDNAQLSIADLETVFKYDPKESTIVRMLSSQDVRFGPRKKIRLHAHQSVATRNFFTRKSYTMGPIH
jgi:hypothetical protein